MSAIERLRTVEFKQSLRGYNVDAVDDYLEELAVSFEDDAMGTGRPTPEAVRRKMFPVALRGYRVQDVDDYLESVAEELSNGAFE